MSDTFTAKALGDYLCIFEESVKQLIALTLTPMNPDALTEENVALLLVKNPNLIGTVDEFVSWYYLDYSIDAAEATGKRYNLIQARNWKRMVGYE
jgi:hypothetical protein